MILQCNAERYVTTYILFYVPFKWLSVKNKQFRYLEALSRSFIQENLKERIIVVSSSNHPLDALSPHKAMFINNQWQLA